MTDPNLEQQIAEQRRLAEEAMREAEIAERSGISWLAQACRNKAAVHRQMEAGLISMRTDERVEEMERERGLR